MKPETVQNGGRVDCKEARQASVIDEVELGFIRRMEMGRGRAVEEIVGREIDI